MPQNPLSQVARRIDTALGTTKASAPTTSTSRPAAPPTAKRAPTNTDYQGALPNLSTGVAREHQRLHGAGAKLSGTYDPSKSDDDNALAMRPRAATYGKDIRLPPDHAQSDAMNAEKQHLLDLLADTGPINFPDLLAMLHARRYTGAITLHFLKGSANSCEVASDSVVIRLDTPAVTPAGHRRTA